MSRTLQRYHPAVSACYWLAVLGLTAYLSHPLCLALSLLGALGCAAALGALRQLRWLLPLLLLTALLGPLFSHRGTTILLWFPWGNPLTLESIWTALTAAGLLAAMVLWAACLSHIETTDRLCCLLGRVAPMLALLLSMTLRFLPQLRQRLTRIHAAQAAFAPQRRIRRAGAELTALLGWSAEHAMHTADAMKCRGYSLPGRSAYQLWRWRREDTLAVLLTLALSAAVAAGQAVGALRWRYLPVVAAGQAVGALRWRYLPVVMGGWSRYSIVALAAFGLLCALPLLVWGEEALHWKFSQRRG